MDNQTNLALDGLSKEERDALKKLLYTMPSAGKDESVKNVYVSLAYTSMNLNALSTSSYDEDSWIITPEPFVTTVNGASSKIEGTGSVILTKDLIINHVLYVPALKCNLITVKRLTHD